MIDEEKAVKMVDIAPLIRGEFKSIMIPWIKAGSLGNFDLRLIKKVKFANGTCEECGTPEQVMSDCELDKFCPGCGSEITKP